MTPEIWLQSSEMTCVQWFSSMHQVTCRACKTEYCWAPPQRAWFSRSGVESENQPAMQETQLNSWVGKIRWRRDRLLTPVFLGFSCGSAGKESTCNAGDLGKSPGEGKGYPLQYSGLKNSMDCTVHGVTKSQTRLNDFHFTGPENLSYQQFPKGCWCCRS